jgi:MoaA/NifB/PqqE/SkfB family radical SAM enzyme
MLDTLVLSVTYRCPIRCRYCGVNAGPHRTERMSLDFIRRMIDQAKALALVQLVVFTGGEPFLLGEDLYTAIQYAADLGFHTRIVTNAYWATSFERACRVIEQLKRLGLTELNYSCDDFHQEFIPLERIRWANDAARQVGVPALIAAKGLKRSTITPAYLEEFFGRPLASFCSGQANPTNDVVSWGITVPVGWESEHLTDDDLLWPDREDCWTVRCRTVLKHIVIAPDGQMVICCGIGSEEIPETVVGSAHENTLLQLITQANDDLIINWLALEGPYGIMQQVQEWAPDVRFRQRYVNTCHLCHDLFARPEVRAVLSERVDAIAPVVSLKRAWLEAHRDELTMQPVDERQTH